MIATLDHMVDALGKLPTIGRKSAMRLAMYLLERPEEETVALANAIVTARRKIVRCKKCFNYSEQELCWVCSSSSRDAGLICVVEKPTDVMAVEKSGRYRGTYHVLGGVLSPLSGVTPNKLRIAELGERVRSDKPRELIIGLGSGADAEATVLYLARLYRDQVRVTRLARGLPAGMDLEYVDQVTLSQALHERTDLRYGE